jgi:uncharacterized Zn finger protein
MWYEWRPYVPAAERRRKAERVLEKLGKKGHPISPVRIQGRTIARTFWGRAWCDNLERYSDYANRLPRGRTYVRNGSVLDLRIAPGSVRAIVSGSSLYEVEVNVGAVPKKRWASICVDSAGAIDSLVELLQGRFSERVMERICRPETGLFPAPSEIAFSCSCPDWASMCKHVAAVLYGVGARLDERPELLFELRKVDGKDLIAKAGHALPLSKAAPSKEKVLSTDGLSELFGLDMAASGDAATDTRKPARQRRAPSEKTLARSAAKADDRERRTRSSGRGKKKASRPGLRAGR